MTHQEIKREDAVLLLLLYRALLYILSLCGDEMEVFPDISALHARHKEDQRAFVAYINNRENGVLRLLSFHHTQQISITNRASINFCGEFLQIP